MMSTRLSGSADVDREHARRLLEAATDETLAAQGWASAPPIRLAALLPGTSDDATALRQLMAATGTAVTGALPNLLDLSESLSREQLQRPGGGVDTAAMTAAVPVAATAADSALRADEQAAEIRVESLASPLRKPAERLQRDLTNLREQTRFLSDTLTVLPPALGHDGRQEYLLAFQNLAEARPTGGVIGAWALLAADRGQLELVATGANDDLRGLSVPVRDLGPEIDQLYGQDVELSQNVNLSPHFPHAAMLLSDLWQAQGREAPDGVIAVDPVALSELLRVTGPLDVAEGPRVDAETVVDVVQAQVYAEFAGQDELRRDYLSRLTATVFGAAVQTGIADPAIFRAVTNAARSDHLLMWSPKEEVQTLIEEAGVGGTLQEPADDRVGVRITNVDGSKLDHHLRVGVTCRSTDLLVSLTDRAPMQVPAYAANQFEGAVPTTHRLIVDLLLPPTQGVQHVHVGGVAAALSVATLQSWTVARRVIDVPRDSTVEVLWGLASETSTLEIDIQPLTVPATITGCEGT